MPPPRSRHRQSSAARVLQIQLQLCLQIQPQLCLQLARTPAASPGAPALLPARRAWPCLQRRRLLGADLNPEPAPMTATAHGPTDATGTCMRMLRYTTPSPHPPRTPPCTYGDVGVARSAKKNADLPLCAFSLQTPPRQGDKRPWAWLAYRAASCLFSSHIPQRPA